MQLSVNTSDSRETLISVLVLLLPSEADHDDLLLDSRIRVRVSSSFLESVDKLRRGGEGLVEGGRVLGEGFEERERSDLLVGGSVLDLLSNRSGGFVGTGSLDVTARRRVTREAKQVRRRKDERRTRGREGRKVGHELTRPVRALLLRRARSQRNCLL